MTTKLIVYTRPDGGVSIVNPASEFIAQFDTEQEGLDAIQAKNVPADGTNVTIIEAADLPSDRRFRNEWHRPAGQPVQVDMTKARVKHTDRIRDARLAKARELIERETIGEDVAAEKAALQAIDLTTAIDNAPNATALHAVWDAMLERPIK